MGNIITFLVIAVVFLFFAIILLTGEKTYLFWSIVAGCGCLLFTLLLTFVAAPWLGYGYVTKTAEPITARLDIGVPYQLVAEADGGDKTEVLLVKKSGSSDFYAIRVSKGMTRAPKSFVLVRVNGKTIAITPPTP